MKRRTLAAVLAAGVTGTFLACGGDDTTAANGSDAGLCVCDDAGPRDGTIADGGARDDASDANAGDAETHAPGSLDLTFGASGVTVVDFADAGDELEDLAILPDGRTVGVGVAGPAGSAEGNVGVAALLANGMLDTTFGAGAPDSGVGAGKLTADLGFPGFFSNATRVLATDAGFAVTAYRQDTAAALRFGAAGALDDTFASGGLFTMSLVGNQNIPGVAAARKPNGEIVFAGNVHVAASNDDAFFGELDTHGALDPAFGPADAGTPGFEQIDLDPFDAPLSVALQSDAKIVVAGFFGSTSTTATLYRLDATGAFDTSFGLADAGVSGVDTLSLGLDDQGQAVAVQPDDKIVLVDRAFSTSYVARYTSAGLVDSSFGTAGVYTASVTGFSTISLASLAIAADGKIVLGGFVSDGSPHRKLAVMRLNANGTLDTTFGTSGVSVVAFSVGDAYANAIAIQPDGRIVVGGYVQGSNDDFVFARFWP